MPTMRVSLRTLIIAAFAVLVAGAGLQGVLSIASTTRSVNEITTLEQRSLVPAVQLSLLSQGLDQERGLLSADLAHMKRDQVQAVYAELGSLDMSITTSARHALRARV